MLLYLSKGHVTVVDDDTSLSILNRKYCAGVRSMKPYALTNINGKTVYLHRLITNAPKGTVVDHINGDTLDNRKENLRVCSTKENIRNQTLHKDKWQKYRGVDYVKSRSKYRARICLDRKEIHLGLFETAEEAAEVYKTYAKKLFGKFSNV